MTKEEKQKKAEEKARRRAEAAERSAKKMILLEALKKYWYFLRFAVTGRACPQDFLLFWTRPLLVASKKFTVFLFNYGGDILRKIYFLPVTIIIIAILCAIFPPVYFLVMISLSSLVIGVNMLVNLALVAAAFFAPVFLAGVKRRINDMSASAVAAHTRFVLFAATIGGVLAGFVISSLLWFWKATAFMQGGGMYWLTSLAYTLMFAGLVFLMWQLHYYSFRTGVAGANFAGDNPSETGMSEQSLAALGGKMASRAWQVMSIAAIVVAAAVAFALTADTLKELSGIWRELKLDVEDFFAVLDYGMLAICTIVFLAMCFVKGKYEKGLLAKSEIDCINESFKQKSATEVEALLKKAEQGEEAPGEAMKAVSIAKRWIGLGVRIFLSMIYYVAMVIAVVFLLKSSLVVPVLAAVLAFGAFVLRNYFMRKLQDETSAVNWQAIVGASAKDVLSAGRAIVKLPFSFSDSKVPQDAKLPAIARKRNRIKYMSFLDPLGIHQFALGQVELGGIQTLFCLLFVGIPISWLWSIFDGIRYSRMTDEEFLVQYPEYCFSKGLMDKFVRFSSKICVFLAPIGVALAFLLIAMTQVDFKDSDRNDNISETLRENPVKRSSIQAEDTNRAVESLLGGDDKESQQGVEEFRQATKELEKQLRDLDKAVKEWDNISW